DERHEKNDWGDYYAQEHEKRAHVFAGGYPPRLRKTVSYRSGRLKMYSQNWLVPNIFRALPTALNRPEPLPFVKDVKRAAQAIRDRFELALLRCFPLT
ncbi:MAG: hypothetical protein QOJ10_2002, partial [Chloroflexota bacterium]|nr:hypothetical protein [Chloroflexota bacterium]